MSHCTLCSIVYVGYYLTWGNSSFLPLPTPPPSPTSPFSPQAVLSNFSMLYSAILSFLVDLSYFYPCIFCIALSSPLLESGSSRQHFRPSIHEKGISIRQQGPNKFFYARVLSELFLLPYILFSLPPFLIASSLSPLPSQTHPAVAQATKDCLRIPPSLILLLTTSNRLH